MADNNATIIELGEKVDAEGLPLIRTADGRTLRRECGCPSTHQSKCTACYQHWHNTKEPHSDTCTCCQGRGWLPVSEDTAVVVIMEWAAVNNAEILEEMFSAIEAGRHVPAAVFAAAKEESDDP